MISSPAVLYQLANTKRKNTFTPVVVVRYACFNHNILKIEFPSVYIVVIFLQFLHYPTIGTYKVRFVVLNHDL